ncbi:putative transcriptional regulator from the CI family [Escherichia coli]|nr:putative transcriptional regulator from the CI family [Escherichia coli]
MTGKRTPPTMTHDEMVEKMLSNPAVKAEYDAIADEFALLDEMLAARKEAGLTQAEVAERMGTKATAITRMESNLASGTSGPSFATLKKIRPCYREKTPDPLRLTLHYRAVILAALYPREISITGLPHPTPTPAISNPVNHFSQE